MANFSLSTPQQQSNLENTKRNVLTNRCKNISFMLNDYCNSFRCLAICRGRAVSGSGHPVPLNRNHLLQ